MQNIGAIILAAGSSNRLGRPKQLIEVHGKPLIRLAVENCLEAGFDNSLVVLGSNHLEIEKALDRIPVKCYFNQSWQEGMGRSLAVGLEQALKIWPNLDGILITVSDQPFITITHLNEIREEIKKEKYRIVSSGYSNTFGPPLACDKSFFEDILQLKGEKGAKTIFLNHMDKMKIISCNEGAVDIDTPNDLKNL